MRNPLLAALATLLIASAAAAAPPSYLLFESGPVRPIALSPNGRWLFVANAPDNRLELFHVELDGGLLHAGSVPVGMEPVAVAARTDTEVWVVNHLSDSVSIVDLSSAPARVVRTLLVGDEPRDVVFAGPGRSRAFVTTAHRGQHRTHASVASAFDDGDGDPQFTEPSVPRADVWVFDAANLGHPLGGTPLAVVELFGDTPRALAVSSDGATVYAAVFHSGNQTTTVDEGFVCNGFAAAGPCAGDGVTSTNGLAGGQLPGGNPGPSTNHAGVLAPEVGLIVQFDRASGQWRDELGRNWSNGVRFFLPDYDVFAIDADTLQEKQSWSHVGTILFNMAVHPSSGKVYVTNAESQNLRRFEGAGVFGGSTVQGNLAQYRISVLSGATVAARHLNKHIDYDVTPAPPGTAEHSLATPLDLAFTADGATLYVAAFGSSKVGVYQTATLESDAFDPTVQSAQHIEVSGGGPAGLALLEEKQRLYVYTRFSNSVAIVDTVSGQEIGSLPLRDPEPPHVVHGRRFLYDASLSSNGEASCSSCHVFGDLDSLAWDLGDPDGDVVSSPMHAGPAGAGAGNGGAGSGNFHPMKGPMTTQTLRGLQNAGGLHWRGDRTNGFFGLDSPYRKNGDADIGDEALNFDNFIVAFPGLLGSALPPTDPQLQADMQAFTDFALELVLPPNPVARIDGTLTDAESAGRNLYFNRNNIDLVTTCNGCHTLAPENGYFGSGGQASFENETQNFKVAHLRNQYQKVGMFGHPNTPFFQNGDNAHKGDQVRGFGFLHDGSTDTLFRFLRATVFVGFFGDTERRNVEAFMLAFPSDLAPVVGQQVTDDGTASADVAARIALLRQRAAAPFVSKLLGGAVTECDLVVHGSVAGEARGYLYRPGSNDFLPDRAAEAPRTPAQLDAIADAAGNVLTYTCAPPGSGRRMAIDRDLDGVLDGDERAAGTDPADPASLPGACSNGLDDDGDGLVDLADPGCANAAAASESPECSNGVDDDGDGLVDGADPHCRSASDDRERVAAGCGLGGELVLALAAGRALRRRRARSGAA